MRLFICKQKFIKHHISCRHYELPLSGFAWLKNWQNNATNIKFEEKNHYFRQYLQNHRAALKYFIHSERHKTLEPLPSPRKPHLGPDPSDPVLTLGTTSASLREIRTPDVPVHTAFPLVPTVREGLGGARERGAGRAPLRSKGHGSGLARLT